MKAPLQAIAFCVFCLLPSCSQRAGSGLKKSEPTAADDKRAALAAANVHRRENIMARREKLLRIIENRDTAALDEVLAILADEGDILSPLAAQAAAALGGPRAEAALVAACCDQREEVRAAALGGIVAVRSKSALTLCRSLFRDDKSHTVRAAAAMGLGRLRDRASGSQLRESLPNAAPAVQLSIAWALAALADDEGWRFLERMAAVAEPAYSSQALLLLGELRHRRAALPLLQALGAPQGEIRAAALAGLAAMPAAEIATALANAPAALAKRLRARWEMLAFLEGGGSYPLATGSFLASDDPALRLLALRCLVHRGEAESLPLIINCLEDDDAEVSGLAKRALPELVQRLGFANPPAASSASAQIWRQWWLGLCRLVSCSSGKATMLLPHGRQRQVSVGSPFEFHGKVTRLQPGVGANNLKGAAVEITLPGQTYIIR